MGPKLSSHLLFPKHFLVPRILVILHPLLRRTILPQASSIQRLSELLDHSVPVTFISSVTTTTQVMPQSTYSTTTSAFQAGSAVWAKANPADPCAFTVLLIIPTCHLTCTLKITANEDYVMKSSAKVFSYLALTRGCEFFSFYSKKSWKNLSTDLRLWCESMVTPTNP